MKRTVFILTPKLAQLLRITYWLTQSLFYRIKGPTRLTRPRIYIAHPLKTQMMDFWKWFKVHIELRRKENQRLLPNCQK